MSPIYANKKGLAAALGVSLRTIDQWRSEGIISYVKVKGIIRFDLAEVQKSLEKRFKVHAASAPKKPRPLAIVERKVSSAKRFSDLRKLIPAG